MKYILTLMLFVTSLFAHGKFESHLHFFNNLHMGDFLLLLMSLIAGVFIYKYLKKETS